MQYMTINKTAEAKGIPAYALRTMLKNKELPGFYSGSRFYVNCDLLSEKLERESRGAVSDHRAEN